VETRATQHWIVSVAREAKLPGAEALDIPAQTSVGAAWDAAARRLGADPEVLAACVASHYRLPVADLSRADARTYRLFPAGLSRSLGVLPLRCTDRAIWAATADPVSMAIEREISQITGRAVHFEITPPGALMDAVARAYPGSEPSAAARTATEAEKVAPHILVVDDDADSRTLLRAALEEGGFRVQEAPDGPEALEILGRDGPFDLVTLDLKMEKMPGLELLRRMRGHLATAGVPVVVATGSEDPSIEMELFDAGADDFVVKPVDPPRFMLRIQAVLRRRSAARGF
jgi:CheY-like chemotaxis protein